MNDIFREVEEDLQEERLLKLWKQYQKPLYGVVSAILLGTLGYILWGNYQQSQNLQSAANYAKVVEIASRAYSSKLDQKSKETHLNHAIQMAEAHMMDATSNYQDLYYLMVGGLLTEVKNPKHAMEVYENYLKKASRPEFKDMALIKWSYLALDAGKFDEIKTRLQTIANKKGAWQGAAIEVLGLVALEEKDFQKAYKLFDELYKNGDTIPALKKRAEIMLQIATDKMGAK